MSVLVCARVGVVPIVLRPLNVIMAGMTTKVILDFQPRQLCLGVAVAVEPYVLWIV